MCEKVGVLLSRMQPLHIGHLGLIDKALSENDKVIILIGSSNKKGTARNPIEVNLRREILDEALEEKFDAKEIKKRIIIREFSIYFSDKPEIIENWFQDETIRKRIKLKLFERKNMFNAVSSTKIREAILDEDMEYIKKSVPNAVIKRLDSIRESIINSN